MKRFTKAVLLTGFLLCPIPTARAQTERAELEVLTKAPDETKATIQVREIFTWEENELGGISPGKPALIPLAPGRYIVRVTAESLAPAFAGPVDIAPGGEKKRITVKLEKGACCSGTVRDLAGRPLPGVQVRYLLNSTDDSLTKSFLSDVFNPMGRGKLRDAVLVSGWNELISTVTGDDGKFRLENIPPSFSGHFVLEKPGYSRIEECGRVCCYQESDWYLCPAAPPIAFSLVTGEGKPLRGAWVFWTDPRHPWPQDPHFPGFSGKPRYAGPSDPDGRIDIIDPPPGSTRYWAVAQGFSWTGAEGKPGDHSRLELPEEKWRQELVFVDSHDGKPIPGIRFRQAAPDTYFPTPVRISRCGEGKIAIMGGIKDFVLKLFVWSPDHVERYLELQPGVERWGDTKTLPLDRGFRFTVHIKGKKGVSLDGLDVRWQVYPNGNQGFKNVVGTNVGQRRINWKSSEEADIVCSGIPPGRLMIQAYADDYVRARHFEFMVDADRLEGEITLDPLTIEKGISVSGRVMDSKGAPLSCVHVYSKYFRRHPHRLSRGAAQAMTSKNGMFHVVCKDETDVIQVEKQGFVPTESHILLSKGKPVLQYKTDTLIEIILDRAATLVVLDPSAVSGDGEDKAEISLLHKEDAGPIEPSLQGRGFSRFDDLAQGSYNIIADRCGSAKTFSITIGEGEREVFRLDEREAWKSTVNGKSAGKEEKVGWGISYVLPGIMLLLCILGILTIVHWRRASGKSTEKGDRNRYAFIGAVTLLLMLSVLCLFVLLDHDSFVDPEFAAPENGGKKEVSPQLLPVPMDGVSPEREVVIPSKKVGASSTTETACALRGKVLGPSGGPVEFAEVLAFCLSPGRDQTLVTETDAEGAFLLEDVSEGSRYHIRAHKAELGNGDGIFTASREKTILLRLEGGGRLFGYVYHSNRVPAARFSLCLVSSGSSSTEDEFESAEEFLGRMREPEAFYREGPYHFEKGDGYFEIRGLRPGTYQVLVNINEGPSFRCEETEPEKTITIMRNRDTGPLEIVAPKTKEATAMVRDNVTGRPIPDSRVRLGYREGRGHFITLASFKGDTAGRVRLEISNTVAVFNVQAPGYAALSFSSHLLFPDPPFGGEREIRLAPAAKLIVFVSDDQGIAVKGARIFLHFRDGRPIHAVTNAEGKAVLENLPGGTKVQLLCLYPSGVPEGRYVHLPSEGIEEVRLGGRALASGPQIHGQVNVGGLPLKAGFAEVRSMDGGRSPIVIPVADGGKFYSGPLSPGSYGLILRIGTFLRDNDHEYRFGGIHVGNGPETMALELPPGRIHGMVVQVGGACMKPVDGVLVRAERIPRRGKLPGGLTYSIAGRAKTDEFGRFEIPVLPNGNYQITFRKKEHTLKTVIAEIQAGQSQDLGEIEIERKTP